MNSSTGRADKNNTASFLSSLQLYDDTSQWGRKLHDKYAHARHVRLSHQGRRPPQFYIPPSNWWRIHASNIRQKAYADESLASHHAEDSFSAFVELTNSHVMGEAAYSLGFNVLSSLPTSQSTKHATAILYSSIIIELAWFGIDHPSISFASHLLAMADRCYKVFAAPYFNTSRGINSNTFANTAILSADRARKFLQRNVFKRKKQLRLIKMKEEELVNEEQASLKRQADEIRLATAAKIHYGSILKTQVLKQQASKALWQQHKHRHQAALAITKWLRGTIWRTNIQRRIERRTTLKALCHGASLYANNVKATRPPIPSTAPMTSNHPLSTPKVCSHPFRDRGIALPKRKRRQRHRPPRKARRDYISSSPSQAHHPISQSITTTQVNDASQSPSTTASDYPITLDHPPSQYHYALAGVTGAIMPLSYWASLTSDARIRYDLGVPDSMVDKNLMGGHPIILPAEQHVISPVHSPSPTVSSDCDSSVSVSSHVLPTDTSIPIPSMIPSDSGSESSPVLLPDVSPPTNTSPSNSNTDNDILRIHESTNDKLDSTTAGLINSQKNMKYECGSKHPLVRPTSTADITLSTKTTAGAVVSSHDPNDLDYDSYKTQQKAMWIAGTIDSTTYASRMRVRRRLFLSSHGDDT